jgi:hypothetical protein
VKTFRQPIFRNPADAATGMLKFDVVTIHIVYFVEVCFMVVEELIVIMLFNVTVFSYIPFD